MQQQVSPLHSPEYLRPEGSKSNISPVEHVQGSLLSLLQRRLKQAAQQTRGAMEQDLMLLIKLTLFHLLQRNCPDFLSKVYVCLFCFSLVGSSICHLFFSFCACNVSQSTSVLHSASPLTFLLPLGTLHVLFLQKALGY